MTNIKVQTSNFNLELVRYGSYVKALKLDKVPGGLEDAKEVHGIVKFVSPLEVIIDGCVKVNGKWADSKITLNPNDEIVEVRY